MSGLAGIERSAAARFLGTPMAWLVQGPTLPAGVLESARRDGLLWVAETPGGLAGFAAAQAAPGAPGDLFVLEMSVALPCQGRGLGRALLAAVIAHARGPGGFRRVTLTTDRELPWNGPFYRRQGFEEIQGPDMPAYLEARLREEAAGGLDAARRCAMAHPLSP
ncbi:GNAT family N-acetyltransferase [Achromobacter sp. Marseille-Q4962]|uniref:GNAT family N-acetyltransferase n=1 Tax=Achromobacter sp. Marseille-Q4962 TaxID=2942202 RepID=UPI0020737615|nr:GNAT family N-acetyltransferase [Achromobacter sp. Marseille-Q4962]